MKRRILALLLSAMVLFACAGFASDNSVLRQDGLFAMQFTNLSKTETHAMQLKQGDLLDINAACNQGFLEITVTQDNGEILYTVNGAPAPETFVEIPKEGIYRISVTGQNASGHVRVSLSKGIQQSAESGEPYRLRRIQGSLGYMIEYDPDFFLFEQRDAGDFFIALDEAGEPTASSLSILRYAGSLETVMEELRKDGQEMPASLVDWRAARTVRYQAGDTLGSLVVVTTVIEARQGELFIVTGSYAFAEEAVIGQMMDAMVASIQFLY